MKASFFKTTFGVFIIMLAISACKKSNCDESVPRITFSSFQIYDVNHGKLTIGFEDCDGDIGLKKSDTIAPFNFSGNNYYNLKLEYWEKRNGDWVHIENVDPPFYYRTPYIDNESGAKGLDGTIEVKLEPTYYIPFTIYDTVKFEITLMDRALHVSNSIFTPDLIKPQ